ncbi:MAG: MerR family transcriptional regulator [Myxococcales bacterium]|nr:MerR family transcriptional regulator [Myxococcales bacterium]
MSASEPEPTEPTASEVPEIPDKENFRIGETAQLVGVGNSVLRSWEAEFDIEPARSSSGQRIYQRHHVARFLRLRDLMIDRGFTVEGARRLLDPPEGPMDLPTTQLHDVMSALAAVRRRVAALRERVATAGPAGTSRS